MNQANLDSLKIAKKNLQKLIQNFSSFHLNEEEGQGALDRTETDFAKWYYGQGKVFKRFSSYVFLESFYNDLLNSYNEYFDIKGKPIQKGFFSDGVSKRKSELDTVYKRVIGFGQKLFSAIDMFVHNVERSKIIERAKRAEIDSEPQQKPSIVVETSKNTSNSGNVEEDVKTLKNLESTKSVNSITNQNDRGETEQQLILAEDEENTVQRTADDTIQKEEKIVVEIENDLETVTSEIQGETIQDSQIEEGNHIEETLVEEVLPDTRDIESKEEEDSETESDLEAMKRQLQEDFDKMLQSLKEDSTD